MKSYYVYREEKAQKDGNWLDINASDSDFLLLWLDEFFEKPNDF